MEVYGDSEPPRGDVPLAGYSDEMARLDNIYDAVNAVAEVLIAAHSEKKKSTPNRHRAPRPVTAYQRLLRERKLAVLDDIENQMLRGG